MSTTTDPEMDLFVRAGMGLSVPAALLGAWCASGSGTIVTFAALHPELCIAAPTPAGVAAAVASVTGSFALAPTADQLRSVTAFAALLHEALPAARQRLLTSMAANVPGLLGAPTTTTLPGLAGGVELDVDKRNATVAVRQWEALRVASNSEKTVPRSLQARDKDVATWTQDAINHGRISHFPLLMKMQDAAHGKHEEQRHIGDGISITVDVVETPNERALVSKCLGQAELYLDGMLAAFTITIPDEAAGGPPGQDGYRVFQNGTVRTRQRYFGVAFKQIVYSRLRRASEVEPYWALPAIFLHALTTIGDEVGSFETHADTAAKAVAQRESVWTATGAGAKDPKGKKPGGEDDDKPGGGAVRRLKGRCYEWDQFGRCSKGKDCPFQGAHGPPPRGGGPYGGGYRGRDRDQDRGHERDRNRNGGFQWSRR